MFTLQGRSQINFNGFKLTLWELTWNKVHKNDEATGSRCEWKTNIDSGIFIYIKVKNEKIKAMV